MNWATDVTAIAALVTAITLLISVFQNRRTIDKVHRAVKTSNGQTIAELVEAGEVRRVNGD